MRKNVGLLVLAVSTVFLHGCETVGGPIHAYEGGQKDRSEIAKLVATTVPSSMMKSEEQSLFCGADGKEFEKATRELYLVPGAHSVCVRYSVPDVGFVADKANHRFDKQLSLDVKAGEKYELKLESVLSGIFLKDVNYLLYDTKENLVATTKK